VGAPGELAGIKKLEWQKHHLYNEQAAMPHLVKLSDILLSQTLHGFSGQAY